MTKNLFKFKTLAPRERERGLFANSKKVISMTFAVCTMFGVLGVNPAQISLEAQAVQLDSEVTNLTSQVSKFDSKIRENLNVWVDYTKLKNYAPSEIEIVIPPNFDPKTLELEGEVMIEEVAETTVSPSKTVEATTVLPSNKTLKITQRQTPKMELENKLEKIAKKFKTKIVAEKFISPSKNVEATTVSPSTNPQAKLDPLKSGNNSVEATTVLPKNSIRISKTDLKPLYESLYPSKQALQNLNKEILQEKIEFKKQENQERLNKTISAIFEGPQVSADQWTSNSSSALVIYNRQGTIGQWAFDIRDNNLQQGSRVQLYTRSSGIDKAQRWLTDATKSKIYIENTNLCLDAMNGLVQGSQIHLWQCHDQSNQQWQTRPDGTIRPLSNDSLCLDSSAQFVNKSQIHLWQCHGGNNQNWRMGENGFARNYKIAIHAAATGCALAYWSSNCVPGHALVSTGYQVDNNYALVNTFSFWPEQKNLQGSVTSDDNDSSNSSWISNNIATRGDTWVDGGADREYAFLNYNQNSSAGHNWRNRQHFIPKSTYDTINYMRGWRLWNYGNGGDYGYSIAQLRVCSSYSMDLWNNYIGFSSDPNKFYFGRNGGSNWTPGNIYYSI